MTRIGIIARLPRNVRDELNRRLEDGEESSSLVAWLNSLPAVKKVLAAKFGGSPVSEQNLSAWRQGGYQDWLAHQEIVAQVEQLAAEAEELEEITENKPLTDHLAKLVAVRYASVLANPNGEADEQWQKKISALRSLCRDVIALRKSEEQAERLAMERE